MKYLTSIPVIKRRADDEVLSRLQHHATADKTADLTSAVTDELADALTRSALRSQNDQAHIHDVTTLLFCSPEIRCFM